MKKNSYVVFGLGAFSSCIGQAPVARILSPPFLLLKKRKPCVGVFEQKEMAAERFFCAEEARHWPTAAEIQNHICA